MLPHDIEQLLPADLAAVCRRGIDEPAPSAAELSNVARWLLSPEVGEQQPVRRYLFYLRLMARTFRLIADNFPLANPGRKGQKDAHGLATSPRELLYLANHLYLLDSAGVPGVVLECGAFKGFSSACLSHACAYLGRTLVIADSFAGLPAPDRATEGHYEPGDFAGSLDEVRTNLATFGRPDIAEFCQGWFSESLRGWDRTIALLWTDVDLYQSTLDVLAPTFAHLEPRAPIFSHELPAHAIAEGRIVFPTETPGAYRDFLDGRQIAYRAIHLDHYMGTIALAGSVAPAAGPFLNALIACRPTELLGALPPDSRAADAAALAEAERRVQEVEAIYAETVAWARSLEAALAAHPPAALPPAQRRGGIARVLRRKD
jgi:hypothetical protein